MTMGQIALKEMIGAKPERRIPFSEYMAVALYHPQCGYYRRKREKIGREGDFVTNSTIHGVYGEVWSERFVRDWRLLPEREDGAYLLAEIGGGAGHFAQQVLDHLRRVDQEIYERLSYLFVETSDYHQSLASDRLRAHAAHVVPLSDLDQLSPYFEGGQILVYSNELFDALPVERVRRHQGELEECFVELDRDGKLSERWLPLQNDQIQAYFAEMEVTLPEGYEMEIPLAMREVYQKIASAMERGILYTVDYGYLFHELLIPSRRQGTLLGYREHRFSSNLYEAPGEMDITAHVQFEALMKWGERLGMKNRSYLTQREWLLQNGALDHLLPHEGKDPFSAEAKRNRAIVQLTLPGGMGDTFRVLTQEKSDPIM